MSARQLVLIGGGARSGKSAFALSLARRLGARRAFLATAQAFDAEMQARIERHQIERNGEFATVEEPLDVPGAIARLSDVDVVVLDCLTLWISNLLLRGDPPERIATEVERLASKLEACPFHAIVVTNEVGMGLVPENRLGRLFRDATGRAHQELATRAHRIYLAALGCIVRLKPSPLSLVTEGEEP